MNRARIERLLRSKQLSIAPWCICSVGLLHFYKILFCCILKITMEINLENAFIVAIKLSIRPLVSCLDGVTLRISNFLYQQALNALEEPLLSTLIFSFFLILLIGTLTYSIMIMAGLFFMSVVIALIEGFVLCTILSLAFVITSSVFLAKIIILGFIGSYKKRIVENHQNI